MLSYRTGLPGWKLAARAGVSLLVVVDVQHDNEADLYIATSPNLRGLIVEANTLDELRREIIGAADALIELELHRPTAHTTQIRVLDPMPIAS